MKVSYSKMILSGVIASSFFAVSCQKKGITKGVQPQTAVAGEVSPEVAKNPEIGPKETPKDVNPRLPIEPIPPLAPKGIEPAKPVEISAPTINISSSDTSVAKPKASKKVEKPVMPASSDQSEAKVETKSEKKSESKDAQKSEILNCSDDVLKLGNDTVKLYTKAIQVDKDVKSTVTEKISLFSKFLKQCKDWKALFAKEKIESCTVKASDNMLASTKTWDKSGMTIGEKLKEITGQDNEYSLMAEKLAAEILNILKSEKLVVSDLAKPLFEKDNQDWKMFIVDGEVQTDSRKLLDAVKAKKVACTIVANPEKYDETTKVTISIASVDAYIPKDSKSEVQSGVDFNIEVKTELKSNSKTENEKSASIPAILSCSNLDMNKIDVKALKAALGKQIKADVK